MVSHVVGANPDSTLYDSKCASHLLLFIVAHYRPDIVVFGDIRDALSVRQPAHTACRYVRSNRSSLRRRCLIRAMSLSTVCTSCCS